MGGGNQMRHTSNSQQRSRGGSSYSLSVFPVLPNRVDISLRFPEKGFDLIEIGE